MVCGIRISTSIIVYFPQLLHRISILSYIFISSPPGLYQRLILSIEISSTVTVKVFYHSLSCLHLNLLYIKKATNGEFPLCLLASIQFYYYYQFFSQLMVYLHLGLYLFHKQQHQYYVYIIQSNKDYQDRLL